MNRALYLLLATLAIIGSAAIAPCAAAPATAPAATARATAPSLTVAILDFSSDMPANPKLGEQIGEILNIRLSSNPAFSIVDRTALDKALAEMAVDQAVVDTERAIKVGKVVGARLLVTGKAFTIDKTLFITAKIVGTETTLLDGVLVQGDVNADPHALIVQLAEQLAQHIEKNGPKLVAAQDEPADPIPALQKKLAGRKLPHVSVTIGQHQVNGAAAAGTDPTVETEIKGILAAAGFTVIEGDARAQVQGGVEVTITGNSVSEFASRVASLDCCAAHADIKMVRVSDNRLLLADHFAARSVNVSEALATKSALQKVGRQLAIRILEDFAKAP